jgi:hypothetical protein
MDASLPSNLHGAQTFAVQSLDLLNSCPRNVRPALLSFLGPFGAELEHWLESLSHQTDRLEDFGKRSVGRLASNCPDSETPHDLYSSE